MHSSSRPTLEMATLYRSVKFVVRLRTSLSSYIKATGFTYTLLANLFDMALDMGRVNDGVSVSYNLQKDADAIDPILAYNYGAG